MSDKIPAVIDTNVIVAALLTKNRDSATLKILDCIYNGKIRPYYNDEIIHEYREVMSRSKFRFNPYAVHDIIESIKVLGENVERTEYAGYMTDPKDRVFYEVSLTADSYLVTGNSKHFPQTPKVVTPAEMIEIIERLKIDRFPGNRI